MNEHLSDEHAGPSPLMQAEVSVIGAVLLDGATVLDELEALGLSGADFADARRGHVFEVIRLMAAHGKPIDVITVSDELTERGDLQRVGGAATLHTWVTETPASAAAPHYGRMVKDAGARRRVEAVGVKLQQQAFLPGMPIDELMDSARKDLDDAFGPAVRPVRFMMDTLLDTVTSLEDDVRQVPTPWADLNETLGGFRPGALYVIGARPGVGKTAIALQCAAALAEHGAVAFSSLEMPERELHMRLISQQATVPLGHLVRAKEMPRWMWQRMMDWKPNAPKTIAFDDRSGVSVFDVRTFARSVARRKPLAGVVVDYLQLMTDKRDIPRHEKVAEMSRNLKILARDLQVPVIALSQLNRASEARTNRRPQLSDLRESGAIEQDADVVLLLHRDTEPKNPEKASKKLELLVAKNRQGSGGVVELEWEGEFVRAVGSEGYGQAVFDIGGGR